MRLGRQAHPKIEDWSDAIQSIENYLDYLAERDRIQDGLRFAFSFVTTLRRTDGFQERLGDWCARAENWHSERSSPTAISLAPLACAVLAAGDINWQMPRDRWPFDAFAGLSWSSGRTAIPAWRAIQNKTANSYVIEIAV